MNSDEEYSSDDRYDGDYPRVDPNFAENLRQEIGWIIDETTPLISERKKSSVKIGPLVSNHVSDKFVELGKAATPTLFASVGNVWTSRGFCEVMSDALKMPSSLEAVKTCLQNKCWKYVETRRITGHKEISQVLYFYSEYDKRVIAILQPVNDEEECCAWFYLEECLRKDDPLFIAF